ncbi:MAG: hypothetical protein M3409_05290, partial [Gemmatimonadota bacterium]|nr:hypothetical protein [Gemmatimonadota bacterium]
MISDADANEISSDPEAQGSVASTGSPFLASGAGEGGGAQMARAPQDKREPVDRVLVTPAGSVRTLARLRAAGRETPGPGGLLLFTRHDGVGEVAETWDPGLGAITEIRSRTDDGKVLRTVNRYTRDGKVLVLTEEQTTMHDAQGRLLGRFD